MNKEDFRLTPEDLDLVYENYGINNKEAANAATDRALEKMVGLLVARGYKQFKSDVDLHLNYVEWEALKKLVKGV